MTETTWMRKATLKMTGNRWVNVQIRDKCADVQISNVQMRETCADVQISNVQMREKCADLKVSNVQMI